MISSTITQPVSAPIPSLAGNNRLEIFGEAIEAPGIDERRIDEMAKAHGTSHLRLFN